MNLNFPGSVLPGGPMGLIILAFFVAKAVVHIIFALGVSNDARNVETRFASGNIWAIATLLGGVFVAAAYWFIHHSSLTASPALRDRDV